MRFAERLYATTRQRAHHRMPVRSESEQRELERRRALPVYALKARQVAADQLRRALHELQERKPCEKGSWSPRLELAREFSIRSRRLGRWLEAGQVPSEFMPQVSDWAEREAERKLRRLAEQGHVEGLIDAARESAWAHRLPGQGRRRAPRVAERKTGEHEVDNDSESGYAWELRVEKWSTFPLIEQWRDWALSRRRPKRPLAGPAPCWSVTAMCSLYDPAGRRTAQTQSRTGRRFRIYVGKKREFGAKKDPQGRGNDLEFNVPVGSGRLGRGSLPYAVKLFVEAVTLEHCELDQIYVHYVIVRNWRQRTFAQRQARYASWKAKQDVALAQKKARRNAQRRAQRRAASRQAKLPRSQRAQLPRSKRPRA